MLFREAAQASLLAEYLGQGQAPPGAAGKWADSHGHAHPQRAGKGLLAAGGGLSREAVPSGGNSPPRAHTAHVASGENKG